MLNYFRIFFFQLLTIDKIKHAERLRGGGDVRGSLNSALDWGRLDFSQQLDLCLRYFGCVIFKVSHE